MKLGSMAGQDPSIHVKPCMASDGDQDTLIELINES